MGLFDEGKKQDVENLMTLSVEAYYIRLSVACCTGILEWVDVTNRPKVRWIYLIFHLKNQKNRKKVF
jgi:hypothetical protein